MPNTPNSLGEISTQGVSDNSSTNMLTGSTDVSASLSLSRSALLNSEKIEPDLAISHKDSEKIIIFADMSDFRSKIDEIDARMARLFEERMAVVECIAQEKKASGRPVEDLEREKSMIEKSCSEISDERLKG